MLLNEFEGSLKGTLQRNLKRNLKGALNGAFKGTFKGKFERQLLLVKLRGESGAHEAPYVALLIRVPGGITGGDIHSGAFRS